MARSRMAHNSKFAFITRYCVTLLIVYSIPITMATTTANEVKADTSAASPTTTTTTVSWVEAKTSRSILQKVLSREQGEGAGARVRRSIGRPGMSHRHLRLRSSLVTVLWLFNRTS
jgi:hypothetical protein